MKDNAVIWRARAAILAALFACAAVVGLTPSVSRGAEPQSGAADDGSPESVQIQAVPVVVVTPSGRAHLVLRSGPEQLESGVAWHVLYLAGFDPAELARPDAEALLASFASDLAGAFRPFADIAGATRLSVTALLGRPGASGAVEQHTFVRDEEAWHSDGVLRQAVPKVPGLAAEVLRDPDEEASARRAAAEFLSEAARADYDAAWARTSAVVKVVMSRTEFERRLAALPWPDAAGDATLYLAFPASAQRALPGTFADAWIPCDSADRVGVRALTLRLDDDMEWRIAGVAQLRATDAPSAPSPLLDTWSRGGSVAFNAHP